MNKFKKITLGLLGAALLTTGLYSCSNDNETTDVQQTENKTASARTASSVLKQYYGSELHALNSVNVKDDFGTYVLTKYAYPINNFTDVYTLTDAKGDIEFLIELDKNAERIKSTNIFTSEVNYVGNLSEIRGLKDINFDLVTYGGFPIGRGLRFWGWSCTVGEVVMNPLSGVEESCTRRCVYNVMGVSQTVGDFSCNGGDGPKAPRIVGDDRVPKH